MIGDEQTIDVELDRNTELLSKREDTWTVDWRSEAERKRAARRDGTVGAGSSSSTSNDPRKFRLWSHLSIRVVLGKRLRYALPFPLIRMLHLLTTFMYSSYRSLEDPASTLPDDCQRFVPKLYLMHRNLLTFLKLQIPVLCFFLPSVP